MQVRKFAATAAAVGLVAAGAGGAWVSTADAAPGASPGGPGQDNGPGPDPAASITTATPIKHLVVIFQENVSFDHYFGTYPFATNADGSPFTATPGAPRVNGLGNPGDPGSALLFHNRNEADPQRLSRSQALTCDHGHGYTQEQRAFDQGLMDKFVQNTDNESCSPPAASPSGLVMDYYDGNTVTAVWNYAQHFSMNDNSFNTVFGPSTAGALNLISGQTHGTTSASGAVDNGTVFGDADPTFDDCSSTSKPTIAMSGRNIGDMLSAAKISWGWFEGGFAPTSAATATAKATEDALNGAGACGNGTPVGGYEDRCGYGPRLPMMVNLTVRPGELRRRHPDRPDLDPPPGRGPLFGQNLRSPLEDCGHIGRISTDRAHRQPNHETTSLRHNAPSGWARHRPHTRRGKTLLKRLIRVGMGAGLAAGSLGFVLIASPAQALGPEGCTAQGANGFVAVGTLAGTAAPNTSVAPSSTACTNPPSATITADGGGAGADSSGWTVTADTAHTAATDVTGTSCGWVANATTGFSTASGTGQVTVGQGCIKAGATVSGTAG